MRWSISLVKYPISDFDYCDSQLIFFFFFALIFLTLRILSGCCFSQGATICPGERTRAAERFTPVDKTKVVFVKLADERGWIPVRTDVRGPPTVLHGW